MTDASDPAPPKKPVPAARLPTLNQLAARITSTKGEAPPISITASRPRLAAFAALRTGSQSSLTTTTSNADSMAVNPPSTRSVSPAASSEGNAPAVIGAVVVEGGEPLTEERIDRLNQETAVPMQSTEGTTSQDHAKRRIGYKNIPSLDAITARIAKQRAMSLSVDGSANPPEPEMIEDPKSPGVSIKAPEHPLQFAWYALHPLPLHIFFHIA
jgi:translation initiation factor 4E